MKLIFIFSLSHKKSFKDYLKYIFIKKMETKDTVNCIYPEDLINYFYPSHITNKLENFTNDYIENDHRSISRKSYKYRMNLFSNIFDCFHDMKRDELYIKYLFEYKQTRNELDRIKLIEIILSKVFCYCCNNTDLIQNMVINNLKINIETLEFSKN